MVRASRASRWRRWRFGSTSRGSGRALHVGHGIPTTRASWQRRQSICFQDSLILVTRGWL